MGGGSSPSLQSSFYLLVASSGSPTSRLEGYSGTTGQEPSPPASETATTVGEWRNAPVLKKTERLASLRPPA